jgi:PAS domain S-box-containing protein
MNDAGNTMKHAIISLLTCTILLILVYLSLYWEKTVFIYSEQYAEEIAARIRIMLIVLSVLISYIVYLLLAAKTRAIIEADRLTHSLHASIEQLNNIYEESPVPYMTLDKNGKIIDSNKATVRFFGVVPEQIKNKNIFSFISKDESEKAEKLLLYYKSNLAINMEELRMIVKDDKVRWVILSVFKMEGNTKHGRVGLATIIDITERKGLDRAKTEFVSLASHQLRTPAATIKWYADMLLAGDIGPLDIKQAKYLDIIKKVNENMIEIIETLLNVSRVEVG